MGVDSVDDIMTDIEVNDWTVHKTQMLHDKIINAALGVNAPAGIIWTTTFPISQGP